MAREAFIIPTICVEIFSVQPIATGLFREKIWPKLLELSPKLEALYCADNGRPAIDPVLLCGVTLLQFMEKAADRSATEHVVYHLGWKYAFTPGFMPRCWFIFATGWKTTKPSG